MKINEILTLSLLMAIFVFAVYLLMKQLELIKQMELKLAALDSNSSVNAPKSVVSGFAGDIVLA